MPEVGSELARFLPSPTTTLPLASYSPSYRLMLLVNRDIKDALKWVEMDRACLFAHVAKSVSLPVEDVKKTLMDAVRENILAHAESRITEGIDLR